MNNWMNKVWLLIILELFFKNNKQLIQAIINGKYTGIII